MLVCHRGRAEEPPHISEASFPAGNFECGKVLGCHKASLLGEAGHASEYFTSQFLQTSLWPVDWLLWSFALRPMCFFSIPGAAHVSLLGAVDEVWERIATAVCKSWSEDVLSHLARDRVAPHSPTPLGPCAYQRDRSLKEDSCEVCRMALIW